MSKKIQQALMGGIAGTAVMTLVMFIAPMMGMPEMNPPAMLSMMTGFPIIVGWMMHFMIGIIFAFAYAFLFFDLVKKISSNMLRGTIFGFAVFMFAQVAMAIMGLMMGGMPEMEGNMVLMMIGSIIGHIIFGIVVALFVKQTK
jgi:hypothetical protein